MQRQNMMRLGFALPLALVVAGTLSIAHAANPTGSCKGASVEKNLGTKEAPNWVVVSHGCQSASTCPPIENYDGVCQEIMVSMNPDGSARFTCGCKYTWTGQGDPPGGQYVLQQVGTVCDSYVDGEPNTGSIIKVFCQGDCPTGVCKRDTNTPDSSPQNTTRDVTCECQASPS